MQPYYKSKNLRLFKGDCVQVMQELPANTFDLVFADPPYHLSNGGFTCHAGKKVSVNKGRWDASKGIDADFEFHLKWLEACKRVLKKDGTLWVSGTYHSIFACGFALQKLDYKILNDIIWYKPNASPNLSCRYFTASHETLIWASKDKKAKHNFNYDLVKDGDWSADFLKSPNKQMRSVWAIGALKTGEKKFGKHPTQKPLELLRRIILSSSSKGNLILDPFTGSSTTGVMALSQGRKFVGIDLEKEYLDLSIKRFKDLGK